MRQLTRRVGLASTAIAAALVSGGVWWLLCLLFTPTLSALDERFGDWLWRSSASSTRESRIILVDIDEASMQSLGPWPWPRERLATLIDIIANEGASLQVVDIIFSSAKEDDPRLVSSLKKNNAVIAQTFAVTDGNHAASGQPSAPLQWSSCPPYLPKASGFVANANTFSGLSAGHITPYIEADGNVRRQPVVICYLDRAYPALFVAALAKVLGEPVAPLEPGTGLLGPHWKLEAPILAKAGLPLDAHGLVRVPWTLQPDAFVSLSAADVLAGRVPQNLLKNAWVVVGSTALGLNDRVASPFSGNSAGMMIHAQLLRGVLEDAIPTQPRLEGFFLILLTAGSTLVLAYLGRSQHKPVFGLVVYATLLVALISLLRGWLLIQHSLWFESVGSSLYLIIFALCLGFFDYARERLERDRLYNHLASYLPAPVAAALALQDPSDTIDAKRRTITVLYADIRNFSAYCESKPPEQAAAVLHAFFSMVTKLVEQNGGEIESFQGDAVLAVWDSDAKEANPGRALAAAVGILQQSHQTLPGAQPDDLAPLALGIGLETGLATVGSFGLARRRTHLAIGHPVTMATHLQEMTVELAHPILLGEGIAAVIGSQRLVSQGIFLLDGLKTPTHIYAFPLRDCVE